MNKEITPEEIRQKILSFRAQIQQCQQDISGYALEIKRLQNLCPHNDKIEIPDGYTVINSKTVHPLYRCHDCEAIITPKGEVVPEPEENSK